MTKALVYDSIADSIAGPLASASLDFARRATELSKGRARPGDRELSKEQEIANRRVMEQTIAAIIMAVAGVEAMINEILADAAGPFTRRDSLMRNVDSRAQARWARLWEAGAFDLGNALEKCQRALSVADLAELPSDRGPVQDFKVLIDLRNALIHSRPEFRPHGSDVPQKDRDLLERKLTGKFKINELVPKHAPFIWQRCLGAGCARWAVETTSSFQNELFTALGIRTRSEISWPTR